MALLKNIFFPKTRSRAWINVTVLTILIFSTLAIVRPIVTFLRQTNLLPMVVWSSLLLFLLVFMYLIKQYRITGIIRYVLLVILLICYGLSLNYLIVAPEERIHFIEYGLLTYLLFQAFSFDIQKKWLVFVTTFISVSTIGYADELVQYILPSRVYDIRDVGLNILSGFLMILFIMTCDKKKD